MYAMTVSASKTGDSYSSVRWLPTFLLHPNVQGILTEEQAEHIALDMFQQVLDLAGDTAVQIRVTAVKV